MKTSRVVFLVITWIVALLTFTFGIATWSEFDKTNYEDFSVALIFGLLMVCKVFAGTLAVALIAAPIVLAGRLTLDAEFKQEQENKEEKERVERRKEFMEIEEEN